MRRERIQIPRKAFRWRADVDPTLNAGLVALWFYRRSGPVMIRNPIFLCFFKGGPDPLPPPPPLDPHMLFLCLSWCFTSQSTLFQSCLDVFLSSWVEPVQSSDYSVLLTDSGNTRTSDSSIPCLARCQLNHFAPQTSHQIWWPLRYH